MRDDPALLWRRATTFAELCELGARFVEGRLSLFPGWMAEALDEESDALVPALAALNRGGLLTLASQPGRAPYRGHDGARWAQRAFVAAFASEDAARALAPLARRGLEVAVFGAEERGGERVPVGLRGDTPYLFAGYGAGPDELGIFAEFLGAAALDGLRRARYLTVVDPLWEPRDLLWREARRALAAGYEEGRAAPNTPRDAP